VDSPSPSSSRQIRKASRPEYVMRPLEFLVAYRGRHWLTDLIRPDGNGLRSLAEAVRSGRSNRLAAIAGVRPGVDEATIAVPGGDRRPTR
jgi:hypothetical protein